MSDRLRQALEDTTEIEEGLIQAQKELAKTRARMEYLQVLIAMGQRVSMPRSAEPAFETVPAATEAPRVTAASVVVPRTTERVTPAQVPARPAAVEAPADDRQERDKAEALRAAEEKIRAAKERTRRAEEMVATAQAEAEAAEKERRATEERARKAEEEARRLEAEVAR